MTYISKNAVNLNNSPHFLLIDLFCGAGGTTTGAEKSGVCKVIAAVNHDPLAISSHKANHNDVLHMTEDILKADIRIIQRTVTHWKGIFPNAKLVLWASLECTNFSSAKGGLPRDADSRALAEGLFRYLDALEPDYLLIENVEDFMSWGPCIPKVVKDPNGDYCPLHFSKKKKKFIPHLIPESRRAGKDYVRWVKKVQSYGYCHDWRLLNAANFGGVTIRERYFGAFWRPGAAFAWPQPTHVKRPQSGDMFKENLKPWRAVAEVLDFEDLGKSIFDRKKPLVDKTLRRLLSGLKKFHSQPSVMTCNSPGYCTSIQEPVGTITTTGHKAIVTPVNALLQSYYSGGNGITTVDKPAPTCTTRDRFALVSPITWIDRNFRSGRFQSVNEPAGSLLTVPKMNYCTAFLVPSSFDNAAHSIENPAPTLLASRKHINLASAFLVNPQYQNAGSSIHAPSPTVIARQQSYPLSLATSLLESTGDPKWIIKPGDSLAMRELKDFMRLNGIADIFMRMLKVIELKRIQGFPDSYILHGPQNEQKKFIGNSVETGVVKAWFQAIAELQLTVQKAVA